MIETKELTDFLKHQIFIAFDTETTGIWAPGNRVVELAAVKFTINLGKIDSFQSLINPGREIPEEVIEIHGITNEDVKDAPLVKPVLKNFIEFCGTDSILIAHNALFDISFIACELERVNLIFGDNLILDTVDIFQRLYPGLPSYSLLNLVKRFGISQSQAHRALSDAVFVFLLVRKAVSKFPPIKSIDELKKSLSVYYMSDYKIESTALPDDFSDLNYALKQKLRVEIDYKHPNKPSNIRIIQPRKVYKLGQYYYINAYCEFVGAERTFRLDRINEYKVLAGLI
ncbi:MAG: exonuclease domain-containing protein [Candidatus Zixiibacteriota bacterium]